jgi:hypothetical protein
MDTYATSTTGAAPRGKPGSPANDSAQMPEPMPADSFRPALDKCQRTCLDPSNGQTTTDEGAARMDRK